MSRQFLPKGTKVMCQETVKYSTVLCPPAPTAAHLTLKDKRHLGKQASVSLVLKRPSVITLQNRARQTNHI